MPSACATVADRLRRLSSAGWFQRSPQSALSGDRRYRSVSILSEGLGRPGSAIRRLGRRSVWLRYFGPRTLLLDGGSLRRESLCRAAIIASCFIFAAQALGVAQGSASGSWIFAPRSMSNSTSFWRPQRHAHVQPGAIVEQHGSKPRAISIFELPATRSRIVKRTCTETSNVRVDPVSQQGRHALEVAVTLPCAGICTADWLNEHPMPSPVVRRPGQIS